jgi:hypothetical protein
MILEGTLLLLAMHAARNGNSDPWTMFDADFQRESAKYSGQNWKWLKAIALNESELGQEQSVALGIKTPTNVSGSKSSDGKSWGLMQMTLTTAKGLDQAATEVKLNNPQYSIALAAKYLPVIERTLSPLVTRSSPRFLEFLIKSYNQGPGNSRLEFVGSIPGYANEYWARFQRNLQKVG